MIVCNRAMVVRSATMLLRRLAVLSPRIALQLACVASPEPRISGTYVARRPNFASLLQLTQTESAHITGVLAYVEIKTGTIVTSEQLPVTNGAIDGEQITLTLPGGIFGANVTGKNPQPPIVTTITPESGAQGGAVSVTVTGNDFGVGGLRVLSAGRADEEFE
jgi:hypothetical protein